MSSEKNISKKNLSGEVKNLRTCIHCGRMFSYSGFGHLYCPVCKVKDSENFEKVKDYIYKNGVATAIEVSEATGVSLKQIEQYLKEGRLEIPQNSPIFIKCEKCNGDIRSGRFCPECAATLSREMKESLEFDEYQIGERPKVKGQGKMRFLNNDK